MDDQKPLEGNAETMEGRDSKQENAGESRPKGLGWWLSAFFFPVPHPYHSNSSNLKRIAVYALTWFIAWPGLTTIFPRAEQALVEQGMNPQLTQELAPGKRIYVRTDNLPGKIHAILDGGPLAAPFTYYRKMRDGVNIGGYTNQSTSLFSPGTFLGLCKIYLKTSQYEGHPEAYKKALLHETRHCSKNNADLHVDGASDNVHVEGDAEYSAITTLAREQNDPSLKERFLNAAASVKKDKDHDVALYLDARFRGVAVPSVDEINHANEEAAQLYEEVGEKIREKVFLKAIENALPGFCAEAGGQDICDYAPIVAGLSPLAQRRLSLFVEGTAAQFGEAFINMEVVETETGIDLNLADGTKMYLTPKNPAPSS